MLLPRAGKNPKASSHLPKTIQVIHNQTMNDAELAGLIKAELAAYQPKDEATEILANAQILLIVSVTSAGKNTITAELIKSSDFYFMVSHTTRLPRRNKGIRERDGREYHFVSNQQLLEMLRQGEFFECKYIHGQQFSGISLAEIRKAIAQTKIGVSDVEVQGVEEFLQRKPDATAIFILPPSFKEWMRRLRHRQADEATEEIHRRLMSARMELETALQRPYYHFVVNDDLTKAVAEIKRLALEQKKADDSAARQAAQRLLKDLKIYLAS